MAFQKGNKFGRGRPKGASNKGSAELAAAAREVLGMHFSTKVERLLGSADESIILQTLKWLADRGFGKAPITVAADGFGEGSPMRIFLDLAQQPIPGRPPSPDVPPKM